MQIFNLTNPTASPDSFAVSSAATGTPVGHWIAAEGDDSSFFSKSVARYAEQLPEGEHILAVLCPASDSQPAMLRLARVVRQREFAPLSTRILAATL